MTGEELRAEITAHIATTYPHVRYFHSFETKRDHQRGYPDLTIAGPRGVLFAECKGRFEEMKPDQVLWKYALMASGAKWLLWKPFDWHTGIVQAQIQDIA